MSTTTVAATATRRTLSPRPARAEARILRATVDQLERCGFAGVTMEGVACAAGVGRATIYRHWSTKADLVMAAVRTVVPDLPAPDTGSLRNDLQALAGPFAEALSGTSFGAVLPAIVEASTRDAEFAALHRTLVDERRRRALAVVERAVRRGEIARPADPDLIVDLLVGPLFYRHVVLRVPTTPKQVRALVDGVVAAAGVRV